LRVFREGVRVKSAVQEDMRAKAWFALAAALLAGGCGDPETSDDRGYTKAPLERPTVMIDGEEPSEMRDFGAPRLPETEPLEFPDSAGG
jgi:hypothetical protein